MISDAEWVNLHDGLDTVAILETVDAVDRLRAELADTNGAPPALRDDVLRLHQLAMAVRDRGTDALAAEFFDLANDLDFQVSELMEALTEIRDTISSVTELYPESLSYDAIDVETVNDY